MRKRRIISIDVSIGSYDTFTDNIILLAGEKRSAYVCVANVHMTIEAYNNPDFASVVNSADIVTPDGMPIAKMFGYLYGEKQDRVAGMDLMPDLLKKSESDKIGVYFYGSTENILKTIKSRVEKLYPKLKIAGLYSPPFRLLSEKEENRIIEKINDSGAGLVLVSLGCPKQEIWMHRVTEKINGVMVGIGGAFPVFAGAQKRAPEWMRKLSLEWVYRFMKEPKRLWKRYLYTNSKFVLVALFDIFKVRVFKKRDNK